VVVVYEGKVSGPKRPSQDYSVRILEDQDELYAKKVCTRLRAKGISPYGHGENADHTCDQQNPYQRYEYLNYRELKSRYGQSTNKDSRRDVYSELDQQASTNFNQRQGRKAYKSSNTLYEENTIRIANNPENPGSSDRMEISERALKLQGRIDGLGKLLIDYKKNLDPDTSILL
jgi:hypothetical protein